MTLVPKDENLRAEVWVKNDDVGFVRKALPVKLKLATFTFQKYGMVQGEVAHVSADSAIRAPPPHAGAGKKRGRGARLPHPGEPEAAVSRRGRRKIRLAPGMQVSAEIHLGTRTVLEYLLSPVQKAFHEAARER